MPQHISKEIFIENILQIKLTNVHTKRHVLIQYIYYTVIFDESQVLENLYRRTQKMQLFYDQIKKKMPNFPFTKDHNQNLLKVFNYVQQEAKKERFLLIDILYEFLLLKKDINRFVKVFSQQILETNQVQQEEKQLERLIPFPVNVEKTAIKESYDASVLFQEIFQQKGSMFKTSFNHLFLFQKMLRNLEVIGTGFKVELRVKPKIWEKRYIQIHNRAIYFYQEQNDFLQDTSSFTELFLLIKVDEIGFVHLDEKQSLIYLMFNKDIKPILLKIKKQSLVSIMFSLCKQLQMNNSTIIDQSVLPNPFQIIGAFVIFFEKTGNIQKDQQLRIKSSLINVQLQTIGVYKAFYIPIFNVYDVYEIIVGKEFLHLETFEVLRLKGKQKLKYFEFSGHRLSLQRLGDFFEAMIENPLLNYEESRALKTGLKLNYQELQIASFRLKRFIYAYWELGKIQTHFLSFKYPFFTTFCYLYSLFILIFYGAGFLIFTLLLFLFLYFHPFLNTILKPFLNKLFFTNDKLNKYFIASRLKNRKELDTVYYLDIHNLGKKKEAKKISFKEQFTNAFNFSSKLPKNIHFFVNLFEKAKNIFLWKDMKKTQMALLLFILSTYSLYMFGIRAILILSILWRFIMGPGYFKRVAMWNSEVLHQLLIFFLKNEFKFVGSNMVQFFDKNKENGQVKIIFSKKFSLYVKEYLDIELSESHWINKFEAGQIIGELLNTETRLKLFFFEKLPVPSTRKIFENFMLSTPSDAYEEHLNKLKIITIQKLKEENELNKKKEKTLQQKPQPLKPKVSVGSIKSNESNQNWKMVHSNSLPDKNANQQIEEDFLEDQDLRNPSLLITSGEENCLEEFDEVQFNQSNPQKTEKLEEIIQNNLEESENSVEIEEQFEPQNLNESLRSQEKSELLQSFLNPNGHEDSQDPYLNIQDMVQAGADDGENQTNVQDSQLGGK